MRDQELIGLYEAYQQVHTQQRVINEEVEIASHYFCEMGLNEIGVQILIEELGVEEFAEFVYDISEEYYLTEERAAKKRTGGESYADVKAKIDAKEAAKKKAKEGAALKRQDAMVSASKQQPKKKGLLDRVAGAVLKGIERHKAATDGMGAATRETAGKIGKAAGEFRKGLMSSYDNWVGQLISDGYDLSNWTDGGLFEYYEQLCEESLEKGQSPTPGGVIKPKTTPAIPPKPPKGTKVNTGYKESYEIVFDYLISEGYADTNEAALAIMASMSEEWKESIVEGYQEPKFGRKDYLKKLSKRGGMGMGTPEDPHGYRDPKMAKVGDEFSKRKTAAMKAKKSGEPDTYRAEKESQSKYR